MIVFLILIPVVVLSALVYVSKKHRESLRPIRVRATRNDRKHF